MTGRHRCYPIWLRRQGRVKSVACPAPPGRRRMRTIVLSAGMKDRCVALPDIPLPPGIRSRHVSGINGMRMHVLEAGFESTDRPGVLLLHGFPELAYSWRKVMPVLAGAGYHVIAPDQRGYGRTTGWDPEYDGDLRPFRILNIVRDA